MLSACNDFEMGWGGLVYKRRTFQVKLKSQVFTPNIVLFMYRLFYIYIDVICLNDKYILKLYALYMQISIFH